MSPKPTLAGDPIEMQTFGLLTEEPTMTEQTTEHQSILLEAQSLVHGDRNVSYGHPLDDFTRSAAMISAMLSHKLKKALAPEDIAMIQICVKLSRQQHRPKRDNAVDIAGYAETLEWCIDEKKKRIAQEVSTVGDLVKEILK